MTGMLQAVKLEIKTRLDSFCDIMKAAPVMKLALMNSRHTGNCH